MSAITEIWRASAEQIEGINRGASTSGHISRQEAGIRPSNPLPYELYADGGLSAAKTVFELRLKAGSDVHGAASAGSPFNVYLRNVRVKSRAKKADPTATDMLVATDAVKAGDTMPVPIPLNLFREGRYEIDVHGPNGFYRSFAGDANDSALDVLVSYERRTGGFTGDVRVKLASGGPGECRVRLVDKGYKKGAQRKTLAAGKEELVLMASSASHGWYDFSVEVEGSTTQRRYAGRVETGRASFSDPLMGGMV